MFHDFLSLLFPETCRLCNNSLGRKETLICLQCLHKLPKIKLPTEIYPLLPYFYESRTYANFYSLYKYTKKGLTQDLLHLIKYKKQPDLANYTGNILGNSIKKQTGHENIDLVIPVPLHPKKKRLRGYNQSEYFAQGLSKSLNIPCLDKMLIRETNTETQTRKSRLERLNNVDGVFKAVDVTLIENKHILLVDDVITTGATLYTCASVLLNAGAENISVATIAVAK